MDEDIRFSKDLLASVGGAVVAYHKCDYKCTFRGFWAICSADPGTAETVTVINLTDTKTLGVATFANDAVAGDEATWVKDVTDGDYVCDVGDILSFTITQCTAAVMVSMGYELDPKSRVP
ncbi:MAG: hypothetical protein DRH97_01875 [Chloroflexi bacterium]|nr:MAG: hypothetical protein DRH97_01875 [Chloroflexota bacterium]